MVRVVCSYLSLFLFPLVFLSCSSKESERPKETNVSLATDSSVVALTVALTPDQQTWLANRYGPESGIIKYEVKSGGTTTHRTTYFTEHGLREAHYLNFGTEQSPLQHITILDRGEIIAQGPGDPEPLQAPWRPDPNRALPNFRNLTDDMRKLFNLKELPSKTLFGKECKGYSLMIGKSITDIWIWEGVMLYSEIKGAPGKKIPPMIIQAISIDTSAQPEDRTFSIK